MYTCSAGHEHPDALVDEWGRDGNGDGLGPTPVCPELVESPTAPRTRQGDAPLQHCKRQLAYVPGEAPPLPEEE